MLTLASRTYTRFGSRTFLFSQRDSRERLSTSQFVLYVNPIRTEGDEGRIIIRSAVAVKVLRCNDGEEFVGTRVNKRSNYLAILFIRCHPNFGDFENWQDLPSFSVFVFRKPVHHPFS